MSIFDPISVILVTAGSRGEALLFRYPFCIENRVENNDVEDDRGSVCSVDSQSDRKLRSSSFVKKGCLNYSDKTLANILTPREKLCGKKFELRIDDVLFVGHPTLVTTELQSQRSKKQNKDGGITIKLFNIVFALQADVESSVIECYHSLSLKIAIALKHEELRCGYFSQERQTMLSIHDEVSEMPEANEVSPFSLILPKSTLAKDLCQTFDSICETGVVALKINNWVVVSFCMPHKVHNITSEIIVKPEAVQACLAAMRPYHTLLMLVDETSLSLSLPEDCSPDLLRFVKMTTPLKSFQTLSQDTDIPLSLIFSIAAHLVYWGKARIIYPLCESNVYVVSPAATLHLKSSLADQFAAKYPNISLHEQLAHYSLPIPLGEHANPLWSPAEKTAQVQRVIWMLEHQLLIQLHMYIYLVPNFEQSSSVSIYGASDRNIDDENHDIHSSERVLQFDTTNTPELSEEFYQMFSTEDPEDLKLFQRLCRYFQGNHHFEEIMYYENLRRNELLTLLEKFREVLFICQHKDPATVYHTKAG